MYSVFILTVDKSKDGMINGNSINLKMNKKISTAKSMKAGNSKEDTIKNCHQYS